MLGAGVAAALNLVVNLSLIPSMGSDGAAIATAAALIAATLVWLHVHELLRSFRQLIAVLTVVTVSAVAVAAVPSTAVLLGAATVATGIVLVSRAEALGLWR